MALNSYEKQWNVLNMPWNVRIIFVLYPAVKNSNVDSMHYNIMHTVHKMGYCLLSSRYDSIIKSFPVTIHRRNSSTKPNWAESI